MVMRHRGSVVYRQPDITVMQILFSSSAITEGSSLESPLMDGIPYSDEHEPWD